MIFPMFQSLSSLSDEMLMRRVFLKDDDRAFDELYHRHARRLMGFFLRQLNHDEALAADLTQDTFTRVWSAREGYNQGNFSTWLFSIAYNLCKNHYRHLAYEQTYEQEIQHLSNEEQDDRFDQQIDQAAFDKALKAELEQLPPPMRLLFSLRYEEEHTIPQIAVIIGIPEGTVKSRLHTLTQTLKQKLQHYGKL